MPYTVIIASFRTQPSLILSSFKFTTLFALGIDTLNETRNKFSDTIIALTTADFVKAKAMQGKAGYILIRPLSMVSLLNIAEAQKDNS